MKRRIGRVLVMSLLLLVVLSDNYVFAEDANSTTGAVNGKPVSVQGTIEAVKVFLSTKGVEFALNVIAALLIFFIGKWVAKVVSNFLAKSLSKAKVESTLVKFTQNLCYAALLVFVLIAVLARLGIQTASFIAVVGAAGLAVGLALQGSLASFASGVLIILFRPFRAGDFVDVAGTKGSVKEIRIFNTILNTPDNVRVTIPNAQITSGSIFNYTVNGTRRVDMVIGIAYEDDIKKGASVIETVVQQDQRVLKDPAPVVAISELGESSVNFVVRPWVNVADYWGVYFDLNAKIKLALEQNGLTIPFPQRDVHIKNKAG